MDNKFIEPKNYITMPSIPVNFPIKKQLNINNIKDLEDVKRVLELLHIEAYWDGITQSDGFDKVKDLFE
jgi:hypothetical protein